MDWDRIERTLVLEAPRERVWSALADAVELQKWFAPRVELDLVVGGTAVFAWEAEGVTANGVVEEIEEPTRFAYRWEAHQGGGRMTRVQFELEEVEAGTQLTLLETGFRELPPESLASHEQGWDTELAELREHLGAHAIA